MGKQSGPAAQPHRPCALAVRRLLWYPAQSEPVQQQQPHAQAKPVLGLRAARAGRLSPSMDVLDVDRLADQKIALLSVAFIFLRVRDVKEMFWKIVS